MACLPVMLSVVAVRIEEKGCEEEGMGPEE